MQNQRSKFSIPRGVTYLNCAYMSPVMKSVERAGIKGIQSKRNPFEISPQDFFTTSDLLRSAFAALVTAPSERVAIIPSVSYGMAAVAGNLRMAPGAKIVVASEQFPSNYYPWQRVAAARGGSVEAIAPPPVTEGRGKQWNERLLNAIDKTTTMVALGHVHWADGTLFDLAAIRKRTHEVGALLVIDGTQSVGALPFDVSQIRPDALVCAGYKWLMGPYTIGMAYFGEYFDQGTPVEENWINRWKSEDFTSLVQYQSAYQPGARRYDMGERSNFILVPMMLEALNQLNKWGPGNIQQYCGKISVKAVQKLRKAGFWVEDETYRGKHLFGVRFPERTDIEKVKARLKQRKIGVSFRGNSMRVSPNVYNDVRDFEKLVETLVR